MKSGRDFLIFKSSFKNQWVSFQLTCETDEVAIVGTNTDGAGTIVIDFDEVSVSVLVVFHIERESVAFFSIVALLLVGLDTLTEIQSFGVAASVGIDGIGIAEIR